MIWHYLELRDWQNVKKYAYAPQLISLFAKEPTNTMCEEGPEAGRVLAER